MSLSLCFLLLTALNDPGIVFSNQVSNLFLRGLNKDGEEMGLQRSDSDENYCQFCDLYIPPECNARHCYDCGVCIRGHDHHCPWVGKCIGKGNMKYFIAFNISWILYILELVILTFLL